ncbi:hypothetical protein [Vibrio marisflavi]|uniref:Uncharacterized protein n=1 Tax=Vibrio marisflavi CECT 7928 TaxID=634439 RepID=A0ABN8E3Q8_9VIBR|nr:hypothetical protein [Vibrio marisflavi]CAH0539961.1 hypothetical protein VMF7928_02545 [Vibrio marisflavi CECT 7928]
MEIRKKFSEWYLERKTKQIASKLVPWLKINGEKPVYTKEDVDYALERTKIDLKYKELAYAIFCGDSQRSESLRKQGLNRYLARKSRRPKRFGRFPIQP